MAAMIMKMREHPLRELGKTLSYRTNGADKFWSGHDESAHPCSQHDLNGEWMCSLPSEGNGLSFIG